MQHSCRQWIGPDQLFCPHCGGLVRDGSGNPIGPAEPVAPQAASGVDPTLAISAGGSNPPRICTGWCGQELPPEARECPWCGTPVPASSPPLVPGERPATPVGRVDLILPNGGRVRLERDKELLIGRTAPDIAVANALAPLDTVGRHHAIVRWSGDTITVTDLGSVNHTWLDGEQAAPIVTRPTAALVLRLGQSVFLHLEPGA